MTIWAEISEVVWSLSALSSPSNLSGYIHRSQGDTVARRGGEKGLAKESGAPAGLGTQVVILMKEGVLSLLLPSALSRCLWFLSVPLLLPRHSGNGCPARSEWGLWGEHWGSSGDGRQTSSVKTLPVLTREGPGACHCPEVSEAISAPFAGLKRLSSRGGSPLTTSAPVLDSVYNQMLGRISVVKVKTSVPKRLGLRPRCGLCAGRTSASLTAVGAESSVSSQSCSQEGVPCLALRQPLIPPHCPPPHLPCLLALPAWLAPVHLLLHPAITGCLQLRW